MPKKPVTIPVSTAIAANILGNSLDTYDFALYGSLTPIIARIFFPADDPSVTLIYGYMAFALSFVARPFGGLIFGYIGDTLGRKKTLLYSIVAMIIPSILLGMLPGFETIGVAAPTLLLLIRLTQGLSMGGEYTSTIVYLDELAGDDKTKSAHYAAYTSVGGLVGVLFGVVLSTSLAYYLGDSNFESWGWRIPFLVSLLIGAIGYWQRAHLHESPKFNALKQRLTMSQLLSEVYAYRWQVLLAGAIAFFAGVIFWMILAYLATYYSHDLHIRLSSAYTIQLMGIAIGIISIMATGKLTEYIAPRWLVISGLVGFIIISYPLNIVLLYDVDLLTISLFQAILCVLLGLYLGSMPGALCQLFPVEVRCTLIGVSYNLAIMLSGFVPLVATYLIMVDGLTVPGVLITVCAVISLIIVALVRVGSTEE